MTMESWWRMKRLIIILNIMENSLSSSCNMQMLMVIKRLVSLSFSSLLPCCICLRKFCKMISRSMEERWMPSNFHKLWQFIEKKLNLEKDHKINAAMELLRLDRFQLMMMISTRLIKKLQPNCLVIKNILQQLTVLNGNKT